MMRSSDTASNMIFNIIDDVIVPCVAKIVRLTRGQYNAPGEFHTFFFFKKLVRII